MQSYFFTVPYGCVQNGHFSEIAHLAKKDVNGGIVGIWGAMSDISHSFKPWEDGFSKGLYLKL